jgi:hypothetical protein
MNKTTDAINSLSDFFSHTEDVEFTAFQLRRAAYMLVNMINVADSTELAKDVSDINFHLHQLAEILDPYFKRYENPKMPVV